MVLIPKTEDLSSKIDDRLMTCLNPSYKSFTRILAQHVKKHVAQDYVWDKTQMGTCEKVLSRVDQLLIDNR